MTGLSLREQLLQAGLVSEKQVKQAEQSKNRQTFTDRKQVGKKERNFREEQRQAELQKQAAAKAAKDAMFALRQSAGHRTAASKIAAKHGSRKAGIPMTGRTSKTASKSVSGKQLTLDFS
jgi:hypothetical protein